MDANERKMREALAAEGRDVEVPPSLEPAAVRARLQALEGREGESGDAACGAPRQAASDDCPSIGASSGAAPRQRRRRRWWVPATAAACLALACGAGFLAASAAGLFAAPNTAESGFSAVERPALFGEDPQDPDGAEAVSPVPVAASYEQLYELANTYGAYDGGMRKEAGVEAAAELNGAADEAAVASDTATSAAPMAAAEGDFSQTNVRTEGVDEADIVKTDGRALFALQDYGDEVAIVGVSDGRMTPLATIEASKNEYLNELYVAEGRLHLIATAYDDELAGSSVTRVSTYDVSDLENPRLLATVEQAGYYHSSRLTGGYLYLFTDFYAQGGARALEAYVPSVQGKVLGCDEVYLPSLGGGCSYLVASSIKASEPDDVVESKALAGAGSVYVSADSIYTYGPKPVATPPVARAFGDGDGADDIEELASEVASADVAWFPWASDATVICKLSYGEGAIEPVGETTVPGIVDDSFSLDEYEGNTRVITTLYGENGSMSNNVYVLDGKLQEMGSITDLAPGERVYSARLMGPIGYFVTYRETDPLFSVDFSDPRHPRVIGALKIPGFSEYLHPWGEGRLLGIGMATSGDGMVTDGMKLSMFDVSDPTDVREEDTLVLDDVFWSQALYDYRAVFVDVERGLVGFEAEGRHEMYLLFTYREGAGFSEVIGDVMSDWSYGSVRGVRVGDVLYVVADGRVKSYSLESFEKIDSLALSRS